MMALVADRTEPEAAADEHATLPGRARPMSLLGEIKRRHVFRVALLYVVSAWVVMQVA